MNVISKIKQEIKRIVKDLAHNEPQYVECSVIYKGYELQYSKPNSIVDRYLRDGDYEPEIQRQIADYLAKKNNPVFVDIGANIGAISLGVLSKVTGCRIFAFEPAPHQYQLFSKTIQGNNLSGSIHLYDFAFGNNETAADFVVHSKQHSAGDGFIDTGRAGKIKDTIKVQVRKLDNWWTENGRHKVDFIKIDTEGSELWVLEGGEECITTCSPAMLIEIHAGNLKNYPHSATEIIDWLYTRGYVCIIGAKAMAKDELMQNLSASEEFFFVRKNNAA